MIKPCGLVCVAYAYPYGLAVLCPVAFVALFIALCSPPHLSSRLCRHRRCLNLACLHASPRPQHLSHRLLALPSYPHSKWPSLLASKLLQSVQRAEQTAARPTLLRCVPRHPRVEPLSPLVEQHLQLLSSHGLRGVLIRIEQHSPEIGDSVHPGAQRHRDRSLRDIRHHYVAHEILLPFGACSSPALLVDASA